MGRQPLNTRQQVAAIAQQRTAAISQMRTPLRRKFNQLERSMHDVRADNLRYYWRIGQICQDIKDNPDTYVGTDGTDGLKLVERALSTQARTLRKAASFAKLYTEEQLNELIELKNDETGYQLNWGHVSFLLTLPTSRQRQRFAGTAVNRMLDPPALHDEIKRVTERAPGHGRRHEMPKTVPAQLAQILKLSKQWVDKNEQVWNGTDESVFGNVMNMTIEDIDNQVLAQLQEIEEYMTQMAAGANENIARVGRTREYVEEVLRTREEQETRRANSEAANGRRSRAIAVPSTNS